MSSDRILKLNAILNEASIGKVSDQIRVVIDLEKTRHAGERQTRHGEDSPITNDDMLKLANRALPKLSKMLIMNQLDIGDEIVIQGGGGLNMVGALSTNNKEIILRIITVMRKKNFKPKPGTKPVRV